MLLAPALQGRGRLTAVVTLSPTESDFHTWQNLETLRFAASFQEISSFVEKEPPKTDLLSEANGEVQRLKEELAAMHAKFDNQAPPAQVDEMKKELAAAQNCIMMLRAALVQARLIWQDDGRPFGQAYELYA